MSSCNLIPFCSWFLLLFTFCLAACLVIAGGQSRLRCTCGHFEIESAFKVNSSGMKLLDNAIACCHYFPACKFIVILDFLSSLFHSAVFVTYIAKLLLSAGALSITFVLLGVPSSRCAFLQSCQSSLVHFVPTFVLHVVLKPFCCTLGRFGILAILCTNSHESFPAMAPK